ncbi:MAG: helix-turn-helix domain-containing protein [Thaumarchaeota archaeon]|nr:helix-turn-helix domain-containing protein [Nitrososphaerota archaeon]
MKRKNKRLYGKRATKDQIMKEVVRLLLGTGHDDPLTVTDTATTLGYARDTIYQYIAMAVKGGLLKCINGKLVIPTNQKTGIRAFKRFNKIHPIIQDPLVAEWKQDMLTRKQGTPISSWQTRIRQMESVCNTCKIEPKDLLVSQKQTEKVLKNYTQMYLEGRAERDSRGMKAPIDIKNVVYQRAQAMRDFCGFHGITWRRGTKGIMSQSVPNHGKYADVRLTDAELDEADRFIRERWGIDSDVYRWFWIGIESCARFNALYFMKLEYTKHTSRNGKTTYIMTAYESKTRHIKGGKWVKYITRPDTQKSIDLLKARGCTRIYESKLYQLKFRQQMREDLNEIYRHLGKIDYFEEHTTHVLRHIGAHYWLAKKNYNYGLVAMIGGWNTIDELRKSYGEIPPEKVLEMIEDDSSAGKILLLH